MRKVSEYKLDCIRIWVRILDVARALCMKLGTFLQAELDMEYGNFVRVRVALPVNKTLETLVAMVAKVKEKRKRIEFEIQYEKLPDFCYTCGYLGHKEKSCGMKRRGGAPTGKFSGKLKCSPPRRFLKQSGTVKARVNPLAYRGLNFSAESTSSTTRGRGGRQAREGSKERGDQKAHLPDHNRGNPAIDILLAEQMQQMTGGDGRKPGDSRQGTDGGINRTVGSSGVSAPQQGRSSDMIPAIANLSSDIRALQQEQSDVSNRGKRTAVIVDDTHLVGDSSTALVVASKNSCRTDPF